MFKKIGVAGWMIRFLFFIVFEYFMYLVAGARGRVKTEIDYLNIFEYLSEVLERPFKNYYNQYTIVTLIIGVVIYFLAMIYLLSRKHNLMIGREYGDAKFADPKKLSRQLSNQSMNEDDSENIVIVKQRFGRGRR